ncbi:MAG: ATP-binding protein [Paludibacter sp.]|jgi:NadR type nicotinamide-nucleotide adenylyltransferase|nr:ATP-binding protein [Paludibacter sp.]
MLKIAITGPESTGKSTLTATLAKYFGGYAVPEYAREYVETLGRAYNYDDVCRITKRQIEEMNFYAELDDKPCVFFDTDLIITQVWFEYCYRSIPEFLEKELKKPYFDLYLLCSPDIAWQYDAVREHGGDERQFFFNRYRREIEKTGKPYFIVSGKDAERTNNAINIILSFLRKQESPDK